MPAVTAKVDRMKGLVRGVLGAAVVLACVAPVLAAPGETVLEAPGPVGPLKGVLQRADSASTATVLIIPGSGPTDHDGNNPAGARPATYRLLAQGLAAQGVSSLRVDKRGLFMSAAAVADPNAVTIGDYADDVRAWVRVLREKTGVSCVWLLGHSEGGLVAMAARDDPGVCGLVLVAAAGRPIGDVLREQLKANPANAALLPPALSAIDALERGKHVDVPAGNPALQALFRPAVQDFLISMFSYEPAKLLAGYAKPVLILRGQRDLQVSERDARLLQQADPDARLVLLPDANHVLKPVATADRQANVAAYLNPDLPLAPGVVGSISEFLAGHRGVAAK